MNRAQYQAEKFSGASRVAQFEMPQRLAMAILLRDLVAEEEQIASRIERDRFGFVAESVSVCAIPSKLGNHGACSRMARGIRPSPYRAARSFHWAARSQSAERSWGSVAAHAWVEPTWAINNASPTSSFTRKRSASDR